jgi:hypothetical protein
VVALNRAVALGMHAGPAAGLAAIEVLLSEGALTDYHLAHADLQRRLGQLPHAALTNAHSNWHASPPSAAFCKRAWRSWRLNSTLVHRELGRCARTLLDAHIPLRRQRFVVPQNFPDDSWDRQLTYA